MVLVLAGLTHEATHWLVLRRSGAPIRPAILSPRPRLVMSLGLGWIYEPRLVSRELRSLSYELSPMVELIVWLGGAAFMLAVPHQTFGALTCLCIGWGMLAGNWWLPHGDGAGWRRVRQEALAASGGAAMAGLVGARLAPTVGAPERPLIAVIGRVRHWPTATRRDRSGTTSDTIKRP
jgi:hypothetical protein